MRKWRLAFFALLALNALALVGAVLYVTTPPKDYTSYQALENRPAAGNTVVVNTTKADFEGIANTYIQKAMKDQPIPLALSVADDVSISTELTVFSVTLPILMKFEPVVQEDGNLLLEQKSVEVGMLDIPPESALKLLRDSVDLPDFMEVMPKDEEVVLKLTEIPLDDGISVRAASFNLKDDDIRLLVTIEP
ncbi:YpmS family protein [Planococcus halocryophilus]|uniref:YpmS family protein n=1 Tax=Planococcus halocryophilus TaxID=1215089 RepID=UPI001F0E050D|nr:YpmS family protein [Planococcus halocryophilus]MCH4827066.1 YpmS family protein [Planococcus halocryophilus]